MTMWLAVYAINLTELSFTLLMRKHAGPRQTEVREETMIDANQGEVNKTQKVSIEIYRSVGGAQPRRKWCLPSTTEDTIPMGYL